MLHVITSTLIREFKLSYATLFVGEIGGLLAHFQLRPQLVGDTIREESKDPTLEKLEKVRA